MKNKILSSSVSAFGTAILFGSAISMSNSAPLSHVAANRYDGSDEYPRCSTLATMDFSGILDAPTQVVETMPVEAANGLPAYCRVRGYVTPGVGVEIGLPSPWNDKFIEMGCGSYCGNLEYFEGACEIALRRGYACIVSDMGHEAGDADTLWAYNNLAAKMDFGYRSAHVAALAGKALVERYYRRSSGESYFLGSSMGGRQALQEVQRFPRDFDGVVAIAPPVDLSKIFLTFAWGYRALHDSKGKPLLGREELKLLTDAAVAECDMDDGVEDGVIGDPLHCKFKLTELACTSHRTRQCLTSEQIEAVKKVYAGPASSKGEKLAAGGPLAGSEAGQTGNDLSGWNFVYLGFEDGKLARFNDFTSNAFRYLLFWPDAGPSWKLGDLDFDRDAQRMGIMEGLYDSGNPDLRSFKAAGGKLLIIQGLNDVRVSPRQIIDYYQTVERVIGGRSETQDFARLFLLPGVGHFEDGPGAAWLDSLSALENWVERKQPPDRLIAAHLSGNDPRNTRSLPLGPARVQFTRPVYPYPIAARYKGRGDPNDAASFVPVQVNGRVR